MSRATLPLTTATAMPMIALSETVRASLQTVVHRGHTRARIRTRASAAEAG
jgi:hypothetical protein